MSAELRDVEIECTACNGVIAGLEVRVDAEGVVKGEHVKARDPNAQSFVKLVVYDAPGVERLSRSEYRHAVCEPFPQQVPRLVLPDTIGEMFGEPLPAGPTMLLGKLREFVEATPLPDSAGHAVEQGWQFALDTYREWAGLDLRDKRVQDASLMTLVHVRNAMFANNEWEPETAVPARIVFTMLRLYAHERLRRL